MLHEFPDATRVEIVERLAGETLAPGGRVLVGDIHFADAAAREGARSEWRDAWDAEEHYAADADYVPAYRSAGMTARFEELSFCAGVLEIST